MSDRQKNDSNGSSDSFEADEEDTSRYGTGDFELQRLVKTAVGQDLYVCSVAQSALGSTNWGGLLGAAPEALGRLGQCFVLASDPLAATLVIPEKSGLPYRSLKANLVECSDKGRTAFRGAERTMKKVSNLALAVCEPGGTIDMVLEAVDDDDLAEIDLPDQLATLKEVSAACVKDATELRTKVDAWGDFARDIHKACVEGHQALDSKETELGDQVKVKKYAVRQKQDAVAEGKIQTAGYRQQLAARQVEHTTAEKDNSKGVLVDLGMNVADAALGVAKSYFNPLAFISSLKNGFASKQAVPENDHYQPDAGPSHKENDPAIEVADKIILIFQQVAGLLTRGSVEEAGVDWDSLKGNANGSDDIRNILHRLSDIHRQYLPQKSASIWKIYRITKGAEETISSIRELIRNERSIDSDMISEGKKHGPSWLKCMNDTADGVMDHSHRLMEAAESAKTSLNKEKSKSRKTQMSRAELRFERFRVAQQNLLIAEGYLNKKMEEEMQRTEEFNAMQLELQRLLTSEATMSQVKTIIGDCVEHLSYFCEKLEELASFFSMIEGYIDQMNTHRVNPFSTMATTTKELGERIKGIPDDNRVKKEKLEKSKQKKLDDLRLRALELKGYYLVAKAMADTYTEISQKYIMPGVNQIGRLSLPAANHISKEQRAEKMLEVGQLAEIAKTDVKRIANNRKNEMIKAMGRDRGEIQEQEALKDV